MVKFSYKKGVYMLVSAISSNSCQSVLDSTNKVKNADYYTDTVFNSLNSRRVLSDKQSKVFDSINEWKYFCHSQIEKGKFDIIA